MKFYPIPLFLLLAALLPAGGKNDILNVAYQDRIVDSALILAVHEIKGSPRSGGYEFYRFSSGSLSAEALISGNADVASMGDAVALSLLSRYSDKLVVLGIHGTGPTRHRLVYAGSDPSSLERVAVKFGTSTHSALMAWLDGNPESAGRIRLIDLSPDMQLSALASGEIDGFAASEPTPTIALARVPGLNSLPLAVDGRAFPVVLMARKKAYSEKRAAIEELIGEMKRAGDALDSRTALTGEQESVLTAETGLEKSLLDQSLAHHSFRFRRASDFRDEMGELSAFLLKMGKIPQIPGENVWGE
jgi:sulfonate transport system substrate-binding protein